MAITYFTPAAGWTPLGFFTIPAAGSTVNLNSIIGSQTEVGAMPSRNFRALKITVPSGGTGNVYLVRRAAGQTVSASGTPNFVLGIITPGTSQEFPTFGVGALINIDDYCLDTDGTGATCYGAALYG